MGKKNIKQQPVYAAAQRATLYNYYHNMFYNLWMGKYTVDGMNYRQNDFFFRKLWSEGYLSIFRKKYLEDEDAVGLATYSAVGEYDGLDIRYPSDFRVGGKKWTTEEILEEVKNVICQL